MFFRGFTENKRVQRSSIIELVEEFCNNQGKKYSEPCSKPHTEPHCSVHEISQETLRQAFQLPGTSKSDSKTPIYVAHEYDMETEICRPASSNQAEPSKPIVLRYPFTGPPIYPVHPLAQPTGERRLINASEPPVLRYSFSGPTLVPIEDPVEDPKDDEKDDEAYSILQTSIDERADSLELDTILEETEGDEIEAINSRSDIDQYALVKKLSLKERRALLLEAFDNYRYDEINPMLDLEDPFREAMRKMSEGNLTLAIMYLEASVQRRPPYSYPKNSTAWLFLGLCRAANDQDVMAIAAFRECLKIEPTNPNALMALAVSYANEDQRNLAVETVWKWLYNDPNYRELDVVTVPEDANTMYAPLDIEVHSKVLRMLLIILYKYTGGFMDVNVHCAIGVMYTLIGDYARSVRYFHIAALLSPRDERLWNRLGSCLANSNNHDEAIKAYGNAAELVPGYVRVRFNWAVSCSKLGANRDAIKQLLLALNHQTKSVGGLVGKTSDYIWSALKLLMITQNNPQLDKAVRRRDLNLLNQVFRIQ